MRILILVIALTLPFSASFAAGGKLAPKSSIEIGISVVVPDKVNLENKTVVSSKTENLCFHTSRDFASIEIISCDGKIRKEETSFLRARDNFCLDTKIEALGDCASQLILNPL